MITDLNVMQKIYIEKSKRKFNQIKFDTNSFFIKNIQFILGENYD